MTKYSLFIDDERQPPKDGNHWVVVKTSDEAISYVSRCGYPKYVSFDHDLGGNDTVMRFVYWILDRCLDRGIPLPFEWTVHSQNPVGRDNIIGILKSFEKRWATE